MRRYLNLLCVLALDAAWQAAGAQERKGIVTGLVTDSAHAIWQEQAWSCNQWGRKPCPIILANSSLPAWRRVLTR
jgi:hypothetical protein